MEPRKPLVIEPEAIERVLEYREEIDKLFKKAHADGREKSAAIYVSELIGAERVLDMLGIEYEDE